MIIFKKRTDLTAYLKQFSASKSIGFVPTMGALHNGHASLIERATFENDVCVCSIFVNPTQFNDPTDYNKYPQILDADIEFLTHHRLDILFAPSVDEMYPFGLLQMDRYNLAELENKMEGKFRPGHFQAVCHIVHQLLLSVNPHNLYMGEKDFQQIAVIRKLLQLTNSTTKLIPCPTLREESGLAMSSRNKRLSVSARKKAKLLYEILMLIKENQDRDSFKKVRQKAMDILADAGFYTEYITLCIADTLEEEEEFNSNKKQRLLLAAQLEGVRLIDNIAI